MTAIPVTIDSTVTDWITALATTFAAIGTVGAFLTGIILWWRERGRDRRAQARLVHGYATRRPPTTHPGISTTVASPSIYVIENNSDEPIYRVNLFRDAVDLSTTVELSTTYALIPAGEKRTQPMSPEEDQHLRLSNDSTAVSPIAFSFVDAGGTGWRRATDGRLREGKHAR